MHTTTNYLERLLSGCQIFCPNVTFLANIGSEIDIHAYLEASSLLAMNIAIWRVAHRHEIWTRNKTIAVFFVKTFHRAHKLANFLLNIWWSCLPRSCHHRRCHASTRAILIWTLTAKLWNNWHF